MLARRDAALGVWLLCCCLQTLQFIRFYSYNTIFYLKMPAYLAGHERLPFQERVLPIFFMKPLFHSQWIVHHIAHNDGLYTPNLGPFYLLSLCSFVIAGMFVQKLYRAVSPNGSLYFLVYPVFLFAAIWSYTIHIEADFSYPYDLPSVAFFAAGMYFIYTRRFAPLLAVMFFGTLNRETTLFLVGIYMLDAASREGAERGWTLRERLSVRQIPWLRVGALLCVWLAVKLTLMHIFRNNDRSEDYVRVLENLRRAVPRLWPSLLNMCGYLLPVVWVMRRKIAPARFGNYVYIFPVWIAVMFYTGVIWETRIYGELCGYVAVAAVLIAEHLVARRTSSVSLPQDEGEMDSPVDAAAQVAA